MQELNRMILKNNKKNKFISLILFSFLFSACISNHSKPLNNKNYSFLNTKKENIQYKDRLVCCKKRCVLASALKVGGHRDF